VGQLIGLSCNPVPSERQAALLHSAVKRQNDWDALANTLKTHRLGPLLHWQCKQYGIAPPAPIRRLLAGLYAREKPLSKAQSEALTVIAQALEAEGIEPVILKGGALAHTVYPEPALRPMEDLDILVAPERLEQARQALSRQGFQAPAPVNRYQRLSHQLPIAQGKQDDVPIFVELHRTVLNSALGAYPNFHHIQRPLNSYRVAGQSLHTLHSEEFLTTQARRFRHLRDPFRAIRLADFAGLAEKMVREIDWEKLVQQQPSIRHQIAALNWATPLSWEVRQRAGLTSHTDPPTADPTQDHYKGWPYFRFSRAKQGGMSKRQLLGQTLEPPAWWAQLAYGSASTSGGKSAYFLHHPQNLIAQIFRRLYMSPKIPDFFSNAP